VIFFFGWLVAPTGPLGNEVRSLGSWMLQTKYSVRLEDGDYTPVEAQTNVTAEIQNLNDSIRVEKIVTNIKIKWNAYTGNHTNDLGGYFVEWKKWREIKENWSDNDSYGSVWLNASANEHEIAGLAKNMSYDIRITAMDGDGSGNSSLNLFGNRLIFFTLFLVAFVAWLLQRRLHESAEWVEQKTLDTAKQQRSSYRELLSNVINLKAVVFLVSMYILWNFVAGAMGFFMPYVYETAGGLSNETANFLQMAMWTLTAFFSYFGFAMLADKVNQRFLYAFGTIFGVAAWMVLTYVGITSTAALWAFVILWGLHAGFGVQAFYALWASELFHARYRAAAQGLMFFLVRAGGALWSFVFIFIYDSAGFYTAGNIMVFLMIAILIIGTLWAPNTRGKTLKQISEERYGKE
jgi:hypothetical protein